MSNPRLFLRPTRPRGVVQFVAPHEAFNLFLYESLLTLDACSKPGPLLPGSAGVCDAAEGTPLLVAAEAARTTVMEEYTPDRPRSALLLHDDAERATEVAQWLLDNHCDRVACVDRAALHARYDFLFHARAMQDLTVYPNEICPGLYLGSAATANEAALDDLQVTHVVSVVERNLLAPAGREHLLCQIPDADDADLSPVLRETQPFIERALAAGGRVLVHCERGASRSVSVVCNHLMRAGEGGGLPLADALDHVKLQRPCAQPNVGFLKQLEQLDDSSAHAE